MKSIACLKTGLFSVIYFCLWLWGIFRGFELEIWDLDLWEIIKILWIVLDYILSWQLILVIFNSFCRLLFILKFLQRIFISLRQKWWSIIVFILKRILWNCRFELNVIEKLHKWRRLLSFLFFLFFFSRIILPNIIIHQVRTWDFVNSLYEFMIINRSLITNYITVFCFSSFT